MQEEAKQNGMETLLEQVDRNSQKIVEAVTKEERDVAGLYARMKQKFEGDELPQVAEDVLDRVHMQDLQ